MGWAQGLVTNLARRLGRDQCTQCLLTVVLTLRQQGWTGSTSSWTAPLHQVRMPPLLQKGASPDVGRHAFPFCCIIGLKRTPNVHCTPLTSAFSRRAYCWVPAVCLCARMCGVYACVRACVRACVCVFLCQSILFERRIAFNMIFLSPLA